MGSKKRVQWDQFKKTHSLQRWSGAHCHAALALYPFDISSKAYISSIFYKIVSIFGLSAQFLFCCESSHTCSVWLPLDLAAAWVYCLYFCGEGVLALLKASITLAACKSTTISDILDISRFFKLNLWGYLEAQKYGKVIFRMLRKYIYFINLVI